MAMNVLTIIHHPGEGPGTFEEYLKAKGITLSPARLYANERLPRSRRGIDGIVSMGGPMNAYDDTSYPFLKEEAEFISEMISENVPMLGICLGAQLIARASGAAVRKAPHHELGWSNVALTEKGKRDLLFQGISHALTVFQWHEDTFDLPAGGELLVSSEDCPHQAFRLGSAYGLQFHIEITPLMLVEWFGQSPESARLLARMNEVECVYIKQALHLYRNFVTLMRNSREKVNNSVVQLTMQG